MRTVTLALAFLPAVALAQGLPAPPCDKPFERPKGAIIEPLTASQYHFAQGLWIGTPPPTGLPASDGGFIVTLDGESAVFLTEREKMVCAYFSIPKPFLEILRALKDGPGEDL